MLIISYQDNWKTDFIRIKKLLKKHVAGIEVEHVGSTSIVGMSAKDIIDIDIIYEEQNAFGQIKEDLEAIGYYHNGDQGITGREVFKRKQKTHYAALEEIPHHLYVCHSTNEELKRHLLFRNHLRINPEARDNYKALKTSIAKKANQKKNTYTILKENEATQFINECIEKQKLAYEK